ncbi:MAG TPA: J domain-containing protein [Nitrospirota bacterium]|nr:J domain-containing protein [Nitrospirota bacterium]
MNVITETEVVQACQTLFGDHVNISRDFLSYLQPSGVKSAYRKKVKENHPDFFTSDPLPIQQKQTALFRDILQAYDVLTLFFQQREKDAYKPAPAAARQHQPRPRKQDAAHSTAASDAPPRAKGDDARYRGSMPHCTLQTGQYLYYRGKITFETLINALIWQRKQRPSFGDIAVRWGLLDSDGLNRIFSQCGKPRLFGEKAVELGLLTVFQVNTILLYQRSQQKLLGGYFVQKNLLAKDELERLVRELKQHNSAMRSAALKRRQHEEAYA